MKFSIWMMTTPARSYEVGVCGLQLPGTSTAKTFRVFLSGKVNEVNPAV
jgi:hypothetical protein